MYAIGVQFTDVVIIETPIFTRLIKELMSDEDCRSLQEVLLTRGE